MRPWTHHPARVSRPVVCFFSDRQYWCYESRLPRELLYWHLTQALRGYRVFPVRCPASCLFIALSQYRDSRFESSRLAEHFRTMLGIRVTPLGRGRDSKTAQVGCRVIHLILNGRAPGQFEGHHLATRQSSQDCHSESQRRLRKDDARNQSRQLLCGAWLASDVGRLRCMRLQYALARQAAN